MVTSQYFFYFVIKNIQILPVLQNKKPPKIQTSNGSLYFSLGCSFFTSPFFFDDIADKKWPAPRPDGLLHVLLGEEDLHRNRPLSTTSLCFIWMDDHGWPYHPRFSTDLGLIHDIIYRTKNNVSLRPYHTRVREMPLLTLEATFSNPHWPPAVHSPFPTGLVSLAPTGLLAISMWALMPSA